MRFKICDTTLRDINPNNYALKVDYLDNLLSLWYLTIPATEKVLGNFKIIKGFSPMQKDCKKENVDKYERYHWSGSGLGVTGDFINFNDKELNDLLIILLSYFKDEDNPNDGITIIRYPDFIRFIRCSKFQLLEFNGNEYSTIFSS